eukprot:9888167-Karenia_brevis.AAC.1
MGKGGFGKGQQNGQQHNNFQGYPTGGYGYQNQRYQGYRPRGPSYGPYNGDRSSVASAPLSGLASQFNACMGEVGALGELVRIGQLINGDGNARQDVPSQQGQSSNA